MDIDGANGFRQHLMALHRRMREEHIGDVALNEVLVIGAIDRLGAVATPSALAADLRIARPNLAVLLRKLHHKNLAERTPDSGDRRRVLISLTPAGRELLARDRVEREEWLVRAVHAALTPAERSQLIELGALMQRVADYRG